MITSDDWIRRAVSSETELESQRSIDHAEAKASCAWELNNMLHLMLEHQIGTDAQLKRIAEKTLDASCEEHTVWGFRNAATAFLQLHDDSSAARMALEHGVETFTQDGIEESLGGQLGCNLGLLAQGLSRIHI